MTWWRSRLLVLSLLVFACGCWSKTAPETVYIGHIAPRSGTEADRGLAAAHAILLAVEDANGAEGQVNGRPVAVIHPDAAGDLHKDKDDDAKKAEAAAVRLITIDRAAGLLGSVGLRPTERLGRVAQQYSTPLVSTTSLPGQLLGSFGFSVNPSATAIGKALRRYAREELKKSSISLIADNRSLGATDLASAFTGNDAQGVRLWSIATADEQKKAAMEAFAAAREAKDNAGAIVFMGSVGEFLSLIETLAQENLDVPVLWGTLETNRPALGPDSTFKNPIYRATAFVIDSGDRAHKFAERYQQQAEFKDKPPTAEAALSYDAANVLFEAMRRAKSFQGSKVRDELLKLKDYDCLTGPLSFDKDQCGRRPLFIVRIADGKETRVARYDSEPPP
jgi:branched-chain amino acid transport system substrate-binding protein